MTITTNDIILFASLFGAICAIFGGIFSVYRWYLKQNQQDEDIKELKHEQWLLTEGILACLDGLEQLGCNHSVPATKNKINDHINRRAHDEK